MKNKLCISCDHVMKSERVGFWSDNEEVILCKQCWSKINKLEDKYKGDIPIEKLDFVKTVCWHCVTKAVLKWEMDKLKADNNK